MKDSTFITHVNLHNYKSIASCKLRLHPLTFLVGPNGSGKSNFLDALRFVTDSLNSSLDHALRDRGGINDVRRRSAGHPTHFRIELQFLLPNETHGTYAFKIGARPNGGFEVQKEECRLQHFSTSNSNDYYTVESGQVMTTSLPVPPAASRDRLFLVNASGQEPFRTVYEFLSRMGFYNLNPDRIRDLQPPDAGEVLRRDGSNLASVLNQLERQNVAVKSRIVDYLAKVVPGVEGVDVRQIGPKETLEFRQQVETNRHPWRFFAANMSDGTLRALGILVALFQSGSGQDQHVPLVGIEEPEVALHPGAAGVLFNSLCEASHKTQVIVTSHSPDLLDNPEISPDWIIPVISENGVTQLNRLDEVGYEAIRDRLYTAGELLRLDQLRPAPASNEDESNTDSHCPENGVS